MFCRIAGAQSAEQSVGIMGSKAFDSNIIVGKTVGRRMTDADADSESASELEERKQWNCGIFTIQIKSGQEKQ